MKIAFRADASGHIGSGHVTRCLALTEELCSRGAQPFFLCREIPDPLASIVESAGAQIVRIGGADGGWDKRRDAAATLAALNDIGRISWLAADRIGLDAEWESITRPGARRILSIDDLARTRRDCDLLLNQNYLPGIGKEYELHVPARAIKLLGPSFALLRRTFREAKERAWERTGRPERILISFGGGDFGAIAATAVEAVRTLGSKIESVTVVTGAGGDGGAAVKAAAGASNILVLPFPQDMASLALDADLVIGAIGVSTWERMALGAPSIAVTLSPEQEPVAKALGDDGYIVHLGREEDVTAGDIARAVYDLIDDPARLSGMSRMGMELVDGLGAKRVADVMLSM